MFGWIVVTIKKLVAALILLALIYFLAPAFNFSADSTMILLYALIIGMIFPDIDVITGFFKKALHSIAVFLFIFALIIIALYPASIQVSGEMCTESLTYSLTGISGLGIFCNAATALFFMAICYIIARAVVGWIPEKNMLHSYFMTLLIIVCAGIFAKFSLPQTLFLPTLLSFCAAYFTHISIDSGYHHMRG